MRIVFFGTAAFAVPVLRSLAASTHEVGPVVTAPARPSGRGLRLMSSPVEREARALGLEVVTPEDPHSETTLRLLRQRGPDVAVLVAYGVILKPELLHLPRLGFINLHPSLLPAYRGAAPIPRAIIDGQTRTGVSVIALNTEVDGGDLLAQEPVDIGVDETAGDLSIRLATIGRDLVHRVIHELETGTLRRVPQDRSGATCAPRLTRADQRIDWGQSAAMIHNRIRGLSPQPGAIASFRGCRLKLLHSRLVGGTASDEPGTWLLTMPGLAVATGTGIIELVQVEPENSRPQSGIDFRNGRRPQPGEKLT